MGIGNFIILMVNWNPNIGSLMVDLNLKVESYIYFENNKILKNHNVKAND